MQRVLSYMIAAMVSAVGWKLGLVLGPIPAFFTAVLFAGAGLYLARRWLTAALG
jgi:hypothetical protein